MDRSAGRPPSSDRARGLRGQLADLRYALDQAAIVAATDVRGTITYVNDKFCEISGFRRDELLGGNHRLINSGYHSEEFFRSMYRTIASGRVWRDDIRNRARDGALYWVDTTIVPFLDETGRPYQYVSIRHDITERRRAESVLREQTGLVHLGRLAAVVAHEVRNPLAGIRGALQIIGQRRGTDAREGTVIADAISRIDTLDAIVEDLLLFARHRPLRLSPISISDIVADVISLVRNDPAFRTTSVEQALVDQILMVDAGQLRLAIHNLLLNAAQAVPEGGVVRVSSAPAGTAHEIRIADNGPGVPESIREHLFEPFQTTKSRGTGLGLVTARRVVEGHGGTLMIENPPGGGAVAIIRLPGDGQAAGAEASLPARER